MGNRELEFDIFVHILILKYITVYISVSFNSVWIYNLVILQTNIFYLVFFLAISFLLW